MQEIFPKRKRGRPTKEEVEQRKAAEQQHKATQETLTGGVLNDDEYFEKGFAERVSAKRGSLLELNDETLEKIFRLGRLACTQAEAAAFMGVSLRTLQNFLYNNETAMDAWSDGLENAKISLRRKQFNLADRNSNMAIFLGKNLLGQKDVNENIVTHNKPANELTESALEEIALKAMPDEKPKSSKVH